MKVQSSRLSMELVAGKIFLPIDPSWTPNYGSYKFLILNIFKIFKFFFQLYYFICVEHKKFYIMCVLNVSLS
jgi:hypothetical protein